jgi:hypothetical protein
MFDPCADLLQKTFMVMVRVRRAVGQDGSERGIALEVLRLVRRQVLDGRSTRESLAAEAGSVLPRGLVEVKIVLLIELFVPPNHQR